MLLDYHGSFYAYLKRPRGGAVGKGKRVAVERDGKLILFNSAASAAAYVQATKVIEKARESARNAPEKPQKGVQAAEKVIAKAEPQAIDLFALQTFIDSLQMQQSINDLMAQNEYEMLLGLHAKLIAMQEEDDMEALLLTI